LIPDPVVAYAFLAERCVILSDFSTGQKTENAQAIVQRDDDGWTAGLITRDVGQHAAVVDGGRPRGVSECSAMKKNHHWQALRTLVSGLGGHADVEIETLRR